MDLRSSVHAEDWCLFISERSHLTGNLCPLTVYGAHVDAGDAKQQFVFTSGRKLASLSVRFLSHPSLLFQ